YSFLRGRLLQSDRALGGLRGSASSPLFCTVESTDHTHVEEELEGVLRDIAQRYPASAFSRRWQARVEPHLKTQQEYLGLLPDTRSCLLSFLAWSEDGRLRAFLVTQNNGVELITFPEESLR